MYGKVLHSPLRLSVVSIEKGAFWSPTATVANFTYLQEYTEYCRHPDIQNVSVDVSLGFLQMFYV